jgi:virulence factor Mce-like protein
MITRLLGSRAFLSIGGIVVVAIAAVACYLVVVHPPRPTIAYCATMPDAVGLYRGNHVTMRGITVGTVTSVEPEADHVRVRFTVDADHPLYGSPKATTLSTTVVADRDLAVLGDAGSRTRWDPARCITETATPKSITQTLAAFSRLTAQLNGDPATKRDIHASLADIANATSGTGPRLNELIHRLGDVLHAPGAAIGHIGDLIDDMGALSNSIAVNWTDLKVMVTQIAPGLNLINTVWDEVVDIVDGILVVLPFLNSITTKYGSAILGGLDAGFPYIRWIGAHIGSLRQLVDMIPVLVDAIMRLIDPKTGAVRLTVAAPTVALPPATAHQVCAALNVMTPGRCRDDGHGLAGQDLTSAVLGLAGAR